MSRNRFLGISTYGWYRIARDAGHDRRRQQSQEDKMRYKIDILKKFMADFNTTFDMLKTLDHSPENAMDAYGIIIKATAIIENTKPPEGYVFIKSNYLKALNQLGNACKLAYKGDVEEAKLLIDEASTRISEIMSENGALVELANRVIQEGNKVFPQNGKANIGNNVKGLFSGWGWIGLILSFIFPPMILIYIPTMIVRAIKRDKKPQETTPILGDGGI